MNFPEQIFKAYDIRGLAASELNSDLAYKIGRSVGRFLRKNGGAGHTAVVGRDMRATSAEYATAVGRGFLDEGLAVADIGLATTPLFNFACANYPEHAGGVMVTASHNPAEYNGFKITLGDGTPVGLDNGLGEIRDAVKADAFGAPARTGEARDCSVLADYLDRITGLVDIKNIHPLKIVIDAGNGMAAATFPELMNRLPVRAEYLYLEPDGRFPNHEANPLKIATLKDLQVKVLETGADFGFALDGDADRIGLVDEKGRMVEPSLVGALAGLEVLAENPGALMLYDLRSSRIVPEIWEQRGARTEMCRVGHAHIKRAVKDRGAEFASELSLHLYYRGMYACESSDLSFLYFLRLLSREKKSLSELTAPLEKYWHSGEINFQVADKKIVMENLEKNYAPAAKTVSRLDGIWMEFDWGWFNVRPSNTEPVLRLNLEAWTEEDMKNRLAEIEDAILHAHFA